MVAVSVVSHGHGRMVERLLDALVACPSVGQIVLTLNAPESLSLERFVGRVLVVKNSCSKGFAANHNAAFSFCDMPFFCSVNPDIEFHDDPFGGLVERMMEVPGAAIAAPVAIARSGEVEDNFRRFPTVKGLLRKALSGDRGVYSVRQGGLPFFPEWTGGMFMLFRSDAYRRLGGFDEGFFLYYEDVDICARAWRNGMAVMACPEIAVVHDARRDSRRKLRFMYWHALSMLRYFRKHRWQLRC